MKIDYQDRIDDYLLGRMSDEERKRFEADAAADAELQDQLKFTAHVQQATKSRNEKLAAMEEWEDDYVWKDERVEVASAAEYRPTGSGFEECMAPQVGEVRPYPRSSFSKMIYWISGIAAVFIAGVFLIRNLYFADAPEGYMPPPGMNDITFRGSSDNSEIELLLGQKRYEEALDLIEGELFALTRDSLELIKDETFGAEQKEYDLQIVKDRQNELKWLKVHTLLGLSQQETAVKLLDELRHEEGAYQLAADSLYNSLKE